MLKDCYIVQGSQVLVSFSEGIDRWMPIGSKEGRKAKRYSAKEAERILKHIKQGLSSDARSQRKQGDLEVARAIQEQISTLTIISKDEFERSNTAPNEKPD